MSAVAHNEPLADYAIEVRIRNARILGLMRRAGIATVHELAKRAGACPSTVGLLVNLKLSPLSRLKRGTDYITTVYRLAAVLNCHPDDMFTEQQRHTFLDSNKRCIELAEAEVELHLEALAGVVAPDERLFQIERRQAIAKALKVLTPRERAVIIARYGLDGGKPMTFEEVGALIPSAAGGGGITRERVRQVELGALHKLGQPSAKLRAVTTTPSAVSYRPRLRPNQVSSY